MTKLLKRQLSDDEKQVILNQHGRKCFATGHEIPEGEQVQFDHIRAYATGGETSLCRQVTGFRDVLKWRYVGTTNCFGIYHHFMKKQKRILGSVIVFAIPSSHKTQQSDHVSTILGRFHLFTPV